MNQRIKVGNFYLDVPTDSASAESRPGAEQRLIAEKSDEPEPLEAAPYIYRPNDPFQSSLDKIQAISSLSTTHKPWVKKAWLWMFVIFPLMSMELFALALKFGANGGWRSFMFIHFTMLVYGILSYSVWLNKTKGMPPKKSDRVDVPGLDKGSH